MTIDAAGLSPKEAVQNYVRTFTVSVIQAGQDATSVPLAVLDVTGGSVSRDVTRDTRGTLTLTVPDPLKVLSPRGIDDLLSPVGRELVVTETRTFPDSGSTVTAPYSGVPYATGWDYATGVPYGGTVTISSPVSETTPLGVYGLGSVKGSESESGVVLEIEGRDPACIIQQTRWVDPYVIPAGTSVLNAVRGIVLSRWPVFTRDVIVEDGLDNLPRIVLDAGPDSDPWQDVQAIARSRGCDAYFDRVGNLILETVPSPKSANRRWTLQDGATATVLSADAAIDADRLYSGVVAMGESTSAAAPVRAVVWDDDENSPTYRRGPLGEKALWYASPLITTTAQATKAANSLFARRAGVQQETSWRMAPIPLVEGDVVRLERPALGVSIDVVVDSIEHPLNPAEGLTVTGRGRVIWT